MSLPPPPSAPSVTHCYRHPDREAWRSCTRCGKTACNDCLVQAAVGSNCLDCAKAARPDLATRAKYWNAKQLTLVTFSLMAINVLVFIWTSVSDTGTLGGSNAISKQQFDLGLNKLILQQSSDFEWYRLISSGFLHFGIIHIAFNMLLLYQLGQLLERSLGRLRFGMLYFAAMLAGSFGVLLSASAQYTITGGASGAVFGLMAAAAVGLHRQGVNIFSTGLGTTLILNLVLTFTISNISIGGHIGGAIGGGICGFIMMAPKWKAFPRWTTYAAPLAVALVAVVGSVVVAG